MGIFDKVEKDAEDMAQNDPRLAQQAGQLGGDQAGQGMQAAQNMIGKQRGARDQDQGQGDQGRDGNDQGQDPSMVSSDPGQEQSADPGQVQDQGW
jgi:hypothetical protein